MPAKAFPRLLTSLGVWSAHPAAFVIVFCYAIGWAVFSPETIEWHSIATLATWLMTLVIQRAEHRDTQAIHAKLGELLKAVDGARGEVSKLDDAEPEEIEQVRKDEQRNVDGDRPTPA